jgi:hypothetical protein
MMDPNPRSTFVTERLAAGLARQAIRDWRDRVTQIRARLSDLGHRRFSTSKGVARVARDTQRLLEPLAFHWNSASFKRHGVFQIWVLPEIANIDGLEYLAIEVDLYSINLDGFRLVERRPLGFIHPHALARLFLRLQTTAFDAVREQIRSSFYMYAALADACRAQQLCQIVIPTCGGYFRCDVRGDVTRSAPLVAKTWITTGKCSQRDLAVIESIVNVLGDWNDRASPAEQSEIAILMKSPATMVQSLADALRVHQWLAEPYEERPDHLTEMWEAARRQAK